MDEHSPLDSPDGNWWNRDVNRRETMWLGISGAWALTLFGWMIGWTQFGNQNQIGNTYRVSTAEFRKKVQTFKRRSPTITVGGEELLAPPGKDVYVGAFQWAWDGLPAVLQPGKTYRFHLGSYDVQHGFSVRQANNLSQQISLQVLPGYEWVIEMSFDNPGTYHVVCNEFCGTGHRSMHSKFVVQEHEPVEAKDVETSGPPADYGGWFTSGPDSGAAMNYDGSVADRTGQDQVTVTVGAEGNGGSFAFAPPAVQVDAGTTVQWEWTGKGGQHNVVHEGGDFESDLYGSSGVHFEHTFDSTGVYKYYCDPHLTVGMKGLIEVK